MSKRIKVGSFPCYYAIVDDEDYEKLSQYTWHPEIRENTIYAKKTVKCGGEYMHKMVTGFNQTDHHNNIGLDNRRINLRDATHAENQMNSLKRKTASGLKPTSQYKGVSLRSGKWDAYIIFNYKKIHLGRFNLESDAAKAYDLKAKELFGEFARTNFI